MISGFSEIKNTVLIKAGLDTLRTGDILSIKILENKNGLIKAVINGKIVNLKGTGDLPPGGSIRVKAEWSGKTLLLNRLRPESSGINGIIRTAGMKSDNPSLLLIQAARRAGLHLSDDNLRIMKKFLDKSMKLSPREARIAAEFIKKGLEPPYVYGFFENSDREGRKDNDRMLLFNSLKSGNELWFIVPFRFSYLDISIPGSLRIKKNTDNGSISSLVIETEYKDRPLYFISDDYAKSGHRRARIFYEGKLSRMEKNRLNTGLNEILGNLRFKIDDNIIERCAEDDRSGHLFDGFGTEEITSLAGVEELV